MSLWHTRKKAQDINSSKSATLRNELKECWIVCKSCRHLVPALQSILYIIGAFVTAKKQMCEFVVHIHSSLLKFTCSIYASAFYLISCLARPRAITPKPSPSVKHAAVADLKLTKDELREVVLVKVRQSCT